MAEVLLHPEVYRGRWIVRCPNCNGADYAFPGQNFQCLSELAEIERLGFGTPPAVYKLKWKPKKERELGFAALKLRHVLNMNWLPHETAKDLWKENKAHGIR